jgi:peptidoglycan/xylan/chitin deacetylase (PgdA/CDA1 family)
LPPAFSSAGSRSAAHGSRAVTGTAARPPNSRISVGLSFDLDGEAVWVGAFEKTTPSAIARGAYATNEALPRVLRLLEKHHVPATFFVPGYTAELHPDGVRAIVDAGHELGHHGYLHLQPDLIDEQKEREELQKGFEALMRAGQRQPTGFRAPGWELSPSSPRLLAEAGIRYDASLLAWDRPYWLDDHGVRTQIVEVPSAWELCDSAHFFYLQTPTKHVAGLSSPSKVEEIWLGDFDGAYAEGGDICYILTMHPEMIGRFHRLAMLERTIEHIKTHDGVWFATLNDIAEDFRSRQKPN